MNIYIAYLYTDFPYSVAGNSSIYSCFTFLLYLLIGIVEKLIITDPDGETRKKYYDSFSESIYHENNIHLDNYNIVINNDRLFIFDHSIYITKLIE